MLTRLAVRVSSDDAGIVLAELLELAPNGLEERDLGIDGVEYAIYGAPGELPSLPALRAASAGVLVDVTTESVAEDWRKRWREFHHPVDVGAALHVRAPWHPPRGDRHEVVIDPGQAFGTGAHPSTRMCLELLLELDPGGALVDVGCGSGVLAIAAAKLGFAPVLALDHELEAVAATRDNAIINGVDVDERRYDLHHDGPAPGAQTVLANLLRPLLLDLAEAGFTGQQPDALIAGGLLSPEADDVAAAFAARQGLTETARRSDGQWAALLLRRPAVSSL